MDFSSFPYYFYLRNYSYVSFIRIPCYTLHDSDTFCCITFDIEETTESAQNCSLIFTFVISFLVFLVAAFSTLVSIDYFFGNYSLDKDYGNCLNKQFQNGTDGWEGYDTSILQINNLSKIYSSNKNLIQSIILNYPDNAQANTTLWNDYVNDMYNKNIDITFLDPLHLTQYITAKYYDNLGPESKNNSYTYLLNQSTVNFINFLKSGESIKNSLQIINSSGYDVSNKSTILYSELTNFKTSFDSMISKYDYRYPSTTIYISSYIITIGLLIVTVTYFFSFIISFIFYTANSDNCLNWLPLLWSFPFASVLLLFLLLGISIPIGLTMDDSCNDFKEFDSNPFNNEEANRFYKQCINNQGNLISSINGTSYIQALGNVVKEYDNYIGPNFMFINLTGSAFGIQKTSIDSFIFNPALANDEVQIAVNYIRNFTDRNVLASNVSSCKFLNADWEFDKSACSKNYSYALFSNSSQLTKQCYLFEDWKSKQIENFYTGKVDCGISKDKIIEMQIRTQIDNLNKSYQDFYSKFINKSDAVYPLFTFMYNQYALIVSKINQSISDMKVVRANMTSIQDLAYNSNSSLDCTFFVKSINNVNQGLCKQMLTSMNLIIFCLLILIILGIILALFGSCAHNRNKEISYELEEDYQEDLVIQNDNKDEDVEEEDEN